MKSLTPPTGWHTRASAATALGVSLRTVETLIATRRIGYRQDRRGCRVLIPQSEIDRYLAESFRPAQVVTLNRRAR